MPNGTFGGTGAFGQQPPSYTKSARPPKESEESERREKKLTSRESTLRESRGRLKRDLEREYKILEDEMRKIENQIRIEEHKRSKISSEIQILETKVRRGVDEKEEIKKMDQEIKKLINKKNKLDRETAGKGDKIDKKTVKELERKVNYAEKKILKLQKEIEDLRNKKSKALSKSRTSKVKIGIEGGTQTQANINEIKKLEIKKNKLNTILSQLRTTSPQSDAVRDIEKEINDINREINSFKGTMKSDTYRGGLKKEEGEIDIKEIDDKIKVLKRELSDEFNNKTEITKKLEGFKIKGITTRDIKAERVQIDSKIEELEKNKSRLESSIKGVKKDEQRYKKLKSELVSIENKIIQLEKNLEDRKKRKGYIRGRKRVSRF